MVFGRPFSVAVSVNLKELSFENHGVHLGFPPSLPWEPLLGPADIFLDVAAGSTTDAVASIKNLTIHRLAGRHVRR